MINRPFSSKSEGTEWFMGWLKAHHFTNIKDSVQESRFAHYDIEADLGPRHFIFELKNRDFRSDTYGDVVINDYKWEFLKSADCEAVLVTFFEDRWIMLDMKTLPPDEEIERTAPRQTWFKDKTLILKKMERWFLQGKRMLDYE